MTQLTVEMIPQAEPEAELEDEEEIRRLNELIAEYIRQRNSEEAKKIEETIKAEADKELEKLGIIEKPKKKAVAVATTKGSASVSADSSPKRVKAKSVKVKAPKRVAKKTRKKSSVKKAKPKKAAKGKKSAKKAVKKSKAKKEFHLSDVLLPVDKAFYFKHPETGVTMYARSLDEFLYALQNLPQESFDFHLREDQNDFANWLKHVLHEHKLANEIEKIKMKHGADREKIIKAVENRVSQIRKVDFIH